MALNISPMSRKGWLSSGMMNLRQIDKLLGQHPELSA
jgi:hypothetical protein